MKVMKEELYERYQKLVAQKEDMSRKFELAAEQL
jgi:hypothetical protein